MRLIDADALGVGRCSKAVLPAEYCAGWNGLVGLIEDAPTIDAVVVVRCKDCKARNASVTNFDRCLCELKSNWVFDDDFCSYGKRRNGNG